MALRGGLVGGKFGGIDLGSRLVLLLRAVEFEDAVAYLGEAGILKQVAPVAVLPLVIGYLNWIVIPIEEARLQQVFGDKYQQYRSKVRRWL